MPGPNLVGFGGTQPHGPADVARHIEIVHRCPQVSEFTGLEEPRERFRKLLLTGRGLAMGLGPLEVASSATAIVRAKTMRVPGRVRVSEMFWACSAASQLIVIRPIFAFDDDVTALTAGVEGGDAPVGRFVATAGVPLGGLASLVAGVGSQCKLRFVMPADAEFLGVHVWNNSGAAVFVSIVFGLEELARY